MADLDEKKLAQMLAGNPMPDWTQHTTPAGLVHCGAEREAQRQR